MEQAHKTVVDSHMSGDKYDIRSLQKPLREQYEADPDTAWIIDSAVTSSSEIDPNHPIHGHVIFGTGIPASQAISTHHALGGLSDFPCPGELLAAAIASCLDTSTRMIANILHIKLQHLEIKVALGVDVRGTLMMQKNVPVGFQKLEISYNVSAADNVTDEQLRMLMSAAERSCVVLQTLRHPPQATLVRISNSSEG